MMDVLERDGVRLAYEVQGAGEPVVLVHGMACNRTHMAGLQRHLADRYRVVAVDLRGHGDSDVPDGSYDLDVFGDDLLGLFDHLAIERPVYVGHSLGGSIGLRLAVRRPDRVRGLVMLDSGIRGPAAKTAELAPFYARLGGPDHEATVREWVLGRLFEPTDGDALIAGITDTMGATPASAFVAMSRGVSAFDSLDAALRCSVPSLVVLADRPFADLDVLPSLPTNWSWSRVVRSGHFVQLVVPEQVHPMVDRFLTGLAGSPGHAG